MVSDRRSRPENWTDRRQVSRRSFVGSENLNKRKRQHHRNKMEYTQRSSTFGKVVFIDHGYGYKTVYAHMSNMAVRKNEKVKRGDLIGYVGNTGLSVAPHLHYEVHKDGRALNPINFYYGDLSLDEFAVLQKTSEESESYD